MSANRFSVRERFNVRRTTVAGDDYEGVHTVFPELDFLWGDGTSDNQADDYWADLARGIAGTSNDDLDLTALPAGPEGRTISFAEIRAILIDAVTEDIEIGTAVPPANVWTAFQTAGDDPLQLKAGSRFRLYNGVNGAFPVSGSDKVLRLRNPGGTAASYRILIVGATA